jgi:hypothetical protein
VVPFPKYKKNVKKIFAAGFLSIPNDYYNHKLDSLFSYLFSLYNNKMKEKNKVKVKKVIFSWFGEKLREVIVECF